MSEIRYFGNQCCRWFIAIFASCPSRPCLLNHPIPHMVDDGRPFLSARQEAKYGNNHPSGRGVWPIWTLNRWGKDELNQTRRQNDQNSTSNISFGSSYKNIKAKEHFQRCRCFRVSCSIFEGIPNAIEHVSLPQEEACHQPLLKFQILRKIWLIGGFNQQQLDPYATQNVGLSAQLHYASLLHHIPTFIKFNLRMETFERKPPTRC